MNRTEIIRRKQYEFDLTKVAMKMIVNIQNGIYPKSIQHACGSYSEFWHDHINFIYVRYYKKHEKSLADEIVKLDFKINTNIDAKPILVMLLEYKLTHALIDFNITSIVESSIAGDKSHYDIHIELINKDEDYKEYFDDLDYEVLINKISEIAKKDDNHEE